MTLLSVKHNVALKSTMEPLSQNIQQIPIHENHRKR